MYRGWHVMKGYFKEPERTAETINEYNWLHTGDLGILDEEGYLQIAGRKKDMVNYGGFKIFPRIVEDFLLTNPQIHEVAVVGSLIPNMVNWLLRWQKLRTALPRKN